jgi:nucleoside-diphosphate-sugar epimerase
VIGRRLVPRLVAAGFTVAGMTRSSSKAVVVRDLGAEPVVCDVYDPDALTTAVVAFRPDVVIHELTDLPDARNVLAAGIAANVRMRREGTRNLVTAARASGAARFLAQSVAWEPSGESRAAKAELERLVLGIGGVVLRYGRLYGDGTYYDDSLPPPPRVHVDEAAGRTAEALDAPAGIIVVADER